MSNIQRKRFITRNLEYVLPPESIPHFENLRPSTHQTPNLAINTNNEDNSGFITNTVLFIGTVSELVLRQAPTKRIFLLITNTHTINTMFVRFGAPSDVNIGLQLLPNGGAIGFDRYVPQDEIHIVSNGVGTTGVMLYSNK